jgi:hypothetical protein
MPVAILRLMLIAQVAANPDLSAEPLFAKAVDACRWTRTMHVMLDFQATIVRTRPTGTDAPRTFSGAGEIETSDGRLHVIKQNSAANGAGRFETLVTPQFRVYWVRDGFVQYTESPQVIKNAAILDRGMAEMGWFLDGVFTENVHGLTDLAALGRLGKIQPEVGDERRDGLDCKRVQVMGDSWNLRIWIVPSRGCNFAGYEFDSPANSSPQPSQLHIVVDAIQFQQATDGTWLISGGRLTRREVAASGEVTVSKVVVKRSEIDRSPDFGKLKAFDLPPIPNGTEVLLSEADKDGKPVPRNSGLKYMWKDGAAVPAYDPRLIERIRQQLQQATAPSSGSENR